MKMLESVWEFPDLSLVLHFKQWDCFIGKHERILVQEFFHAISTLRRLSSATGLCADYSSWIQQWSWTPGRMIFSNGCISHTNGAVNKHNGGVWSLMNHCAVREGPIASERLWYGVECTKKIMGPDSFSKPAVNGKIFERMIPYYDVPETLNFVWTSHPSEWCRSFT